MKPYHMTRHQHARNTLILNGPPGPLIITLDPALPGSAVDVIENRLINVLWALQRDRSPQPIPASAGDGLLTPSERASLVAAANKVELPAALQAILDEELRLAAPNVRIDLTKPKDHPERCTVVDREEQDAIDSWDDKHGPTEDELKAFYLCFPNHQISIDRAQLDYDLDIFEEPAATGKPYRVGERHPSPSGGWAGPEEPPTCGTMGDW